MNTQLCYPKASYPIITELYSINFETDSRHYSKNIVVAAGALVAKCFTSMTSADNARVFSVFVPHTSITVN